MCLYVSVLYCKQLRQHMCRTCRLSQLFYSCHIPLNESYRHKGSIFSS